MTRVWRAIVKETPLEGWTSPKTLRSTRATRVAEKHGKPAARLILGHEADSPVTTQHYVLEQKAVVNYADAR
jgi:integrase